LLTGELAVSKPSHADASWPTPAVGTDRHPKIAQVQ
jgi:hypothetical protein